ncbi:hypothetical protein Cni_G00284 [Canna indica]|uniref:Pollen preferential protein n=1 Tax=Canna indica TaxID=4628 RepID=A0AAQ3JKW5_9LILI|nr:hypothetical protein Cni_G00284 [Canna indica]
MKWHAALSSLKILEAASWWRCNLQSSNPSLQEPESLSLVASCYLRSASLRTCDKGAIFIAMRSCTIPASEPPNYDSRDDRMTRNPARPPLPPRPSAPAIPAATFPKIHLQPPRARFSEVAGTTAAGCAALCCCCPCGIVKLLVIVVLKLPAALVRRALRCRRMRWTRGRGVKTEGSFWRPEFGTSDVDDDDLSLFNWVPAEAWPEKSPSPELAALEREMVAKFYGAGFWRSLSQRD